MQTSHLISDAILALTGFFVFYKYLLKLRFTETLLWESFVLSVAAAAVMGAIGYTGFTDFAWVGVFFQNIATIVGVIGLVVGSWHLVNNKTPKQQIGIVAMALGFVLLVLKLALKIAVISTITSMGGIALVLAIAIYGIVKGNKVAGIWLLIAVIFAALANFRDKIFTDAVLAVDAYHYLLAISLLCFGVAVSKKGK
jgi:hypothetical protein